MTFLHKLARRLASIATVAVFTQLLASCSPGTSQEYLGPDPHKPNPSVSYIGLSITPNDPQLVQGDSIRLQARGWLPSGQSAAASVTWSATGGVVSSDGWYRATTSGSFRVRAVATTTLADSVTIVVIPPGGIARLDITPSAVPLAAGTQQQFTAVVLMGDGSRMYPSVSWSATGGSISTDGLFTAPGSQGSYTVTASTIDGALQGRTDGVVGPPALRGLALAPGAVIMESGATVQFTASASWSDGSNSVPPLSWTATGGNVTPSGVYSAGASAGSFRVIASSALGKADTANVTILPRTVSLRLSPLTALLAVGATQAVTAYATRSDGTESPVAVQWSAEGGTISTGGIYTAGTAPGTYAVVGTLSASGSVFRDTAYFQVQADEAATVPVFVRPDTTVIAGTTVQFVASSSGDGSTVAAVNWSATGGTISSEGLYTAGPTAGSFRVVGKRKNGNKADTASVIIEPAPVLTISGFTISPQSAIIASGESRSFSATLSWSDGKIHPCDISWVSAGGTITQNGLYTAGTLAGTFLVIATGGCGAADTASVTIPTASAPAATLSKVVLSPPTVSLDAGSSQVFTVSGVWSDGATSPPPVTFTATGGSINAAGKYVAGTQGGTYRVIATQTGGSLADTSVVTIQQATSTLIGLVLLPSSATVPPGATQSFAVQGSWSDGSSAVPPVTYTATGGTVSTSGVYTAGTVPGTYRVIATHTAGTRADTSAIVIPSSVTLTQLILTPATVTVAPGGTQQLVVTGSWSDGSTLAPAVTYSATGGTVSPTGLYTAGSATGTFRVIAVRTGGTEADTSVVTIGSAPPPPTGWAGELVVFPNPEVEAIIGPQLRVASASNPWPWFDQTLTGRGLVHGAAFPVTPAAEPVDYDNYLNRNYYDLGLALYTTYYRTGDARFLTYARKVTDSWWLSPNINQGTTGEATSPQWFTPRSSSLGGMMLRALDGRPEMWPWITNFVRGQFNIWVERPMSASGLGNGVRDGGYMLTYAAWLAQVHPTASVRAEFRQKALDGATRYFARLQAPDGGWYWDDPYMGLQGISQPFMVGLLLEGMVATHQLTNDPAIAQSIIRSANWLYNVAFEKQAVTNLSGVYWRAMKYFVYKSNPTATAYTSAFLYGVADGAMRDNRQLNPHSVHAFGYAYKLTGDPKYITWGDDIFAATFGKSQGPGADKYSGLADYREKEFNASYRSAGRYLVWRSF